MQNWSIRAANAYRVDAVDVLLCVQNQYKQVLAINVVQSALTAGLTIRADRGFP